MLLATIEILLTNNYSIFDPLAVTSEKFILHCQHTMVVFIMYSAVDLHGLFHIELATARFYLIAVNKNPPQLWDEVWKWPVGMRLDVLLMFASLSSYFLFCVIICMLTR